MWVQMWVPGTNHKLEVYEESYMGLAPNLFTENCTRKQENHPTRQQQRWFSKDVNLH